MRNVMRADQDLDVDAEISRPAKNLHDAAHRTVTVVAEIENLGGHHQAIQIFNRTDRDRRGAHAVYGCLAGGKRDILRDLDPLLDAIFVGNHKESRPANLKLAHHREMRPPQHTHNLAVRLAVTLNAGNARDHTITVHRACSRVLGDIDVALEAGHGHIRNHEAVTVAVDVELPHGELAADAGRRVVPGACFDE